MVAIRVQADVRAVERDLKLIARDLVPTAAAQGLNRTNKGLRTDIVRAIASHFGIRPLKRVRRRVAIPRKPEFVAGKGRLRAAGLILFAYLPEIYLVGGGVRARRAAQGPNRFVMTTTDKAGTGKPHVGLFERKGTKRLPVREILRNITPEARQITDKVLETRGADRWRQEFHAALANQLRRRSAR